jgi:hypothetical protein
LAGSILTLVECGPAKKRQSVSNVDCLDSYFAPKRDPKAAPQPVAVLNFKGA